MGGEASSVLCTRPPHLTSEAQGKGKLDMPKKRTRDKGQASLRGRRRRRFKQVIAVFFVLLFIGNLIPLSASQVAPERPSTSYGVEKELSALQEKRHSKKWADIIEAEAQGDLEAIDISKVDRPDVTIEENVVLMGPLPPDDPPIYGIVETTTLPDRLTLIEFLISRPASYFIYTETEGHGKWSEGLIRPNYLIDWNTWVEIDVDDDPSTGDINGNDVRARLEVEIEIALENIIPPRLFPLPPTRGAYEAPGEMRLEVEKLSGPNATPSLDLKLYIVKSFSYTGNNYLWMVGFEWSEMPNRLTATIGAASMRLQAPTFEIDLQNLSWLDNSEVVNIAGPYDIDLETDTRVNDERIILAQSKVWLLMLIERTWAQIYLTPADGLNRVPENIHLNMEAPSFDKSFDRLEWTSNTSANLHAVFKEARQNTTFADLLIDDMPTRLMIELEDISGPSGSNLTSVVYEASDRIKLVEYQEYEFYEHSTVNFTHSHAIFRDMPKALFLNGTFEIGGGDEPIPQNIALGLPSRLIDNIMLKITSKLYRISNTLRTIPNNIIHMPEKDGLASLVVTDGQYIGEIEFYVTSKSKILADGDYLAFRNDSREINMGSGPLVNSSLSGRLTNIERITLDFSEGTVLDLHSTEPKPVRILFIDDANDARATLELNDVPEDFYLSFKPNTIQFNSIEPLDTLAYTSQVGDQYFRLLLEGVPTSFGVNQKDGRMRLSVPKDQYISTFSIVVTNRDRLTVLDDAYNHIYLDRTSASYFTSIGLNMIRGLDMQTAAGGIVNADFAEERDLFMYLTDDGLDIETKMLFKPFPSNFTIELPQGFTSSGVRLPNVLDVTSIFAFSPIILQMSDLADDIVTMVTELTSNIADQMGSIGTNTTIKLRSKVPTILIADMRQGPASEVKWLHGLNIELDRTRNAIRARIYLRLPLEATIEMRSGIDDMDIHVNFVQFDPLWDFLDIRINGMEKRDVSVYLDGLPLEPFDIDFDVELNTNMTPGSGVVLTDIKIESDKDLGALYLSMRKRSLITSVTTMYLSSVAKRVEAHVEVKERLSLRWSASALTKNMYVLIQKLIGDEWYDVTLTLNKVPTVLNVEAGSPSGVTPDMDGSLLQGLPEISISGSTASLSIYIFMEGPAMGQPSTYEIHMRDVTDDTYTVFDHSNGVYKIRSQGTTFIYMRIIDMPFQERFQIQEAEIYADEVYSADLKTSEAFGVYPIIELTNFKADSLQLRTKQKLHAFGKLREGTVIYVDISTRGGLPRSGQFTKNGLQVTEGERHLIIPAPIATMMATLFSGR